MEEMKSGLDLLNGVLSLFSNCFPIIGNAFVHQLLSVVWNFSIHLSLNGYQSVNHCNLRIGPFRRIHIPLFCWHIKNGYVFIAPGDFRFYMSNEGAYNHIVETLLLLLSLDNI